MIRATRLRALIAANTKGAIWSPSWAARASLDRKDCRIDCSPYQRTRRVLATVAVTALAAATVFGALNHKPSKADESVLVYTPSFDVEPPITYVDPSLPLASDAFAKAPAKDEEPSPTF